VRCKGERTGKRRARVSVIGAIRQNKLMGLMTFTGTCDRHLFEGWANLCFLDHVNAGDVVILDNARIHKSQDFVAQIEAKGASVLWLPPYSPDKNPIEKTWGTLKKAFRYVKQKVDNLHDAVDATISKYMAKQAYQPT
jgi:transposase